jgi:hypothetical protein
METTKGTLVFCGFSVTRSIGGRFCGTSAWLDGIWFSRQNDDVLKNVPASVPTSRGYFVRTSMFQWKMELNIFPSMSTLSFVSPKER